MKTETKDICHNPTGFRTSCFDIYDIRRRIDGAKIARIINEGNSSNLSEEAFQEVLVCAIDRVPFKMIAAKQQTDGTLIINSNVVDVIIEAIEMLKNGIEIPLNLVGRPNLTKDNYPVAYLEDMKLEFCIISPSQDYDQTLINKY